MQEHQKKNRPKYLNTYKMEPDKKMNMFKIKNSMQKCLEKLCEDKQFEEVVEREMIRTINNQLHNKVRDLVPDRYRFIVQVIVCERNDNDFSISSRSLMNNDHDSYTSVSYAKGDIVVVGICHVLYLE
ncbi:Oidioi.mRNA.OKI2018_I69.chr2.g7272.t1.cds [Oikopleura dioica]|uniref:Oidioi.mRNA.OKI2018_I69.chr2.g7272.t1.cds n=1 Tax=Oikopleura dioica TaxID=34765 RepID=A0ABN7T954_OIKDI|nr:Oidioi.mRNA.OKI2018_I69.chr2.g7272.t1.cds [Oikopleura dioica]